MSHINWLFSQGFTVIVFGVPVFFGIGALFLAAFLFHWAWGYTRVKSPCATRLHLAGMSIVGAICIMASLAAHEVSHGIVATLLGFHVNKAAFVVWGAYVSIEHDISHLTATSTLANMLVSFAGPLMNAVLAGIAILFIRRFPESPGRNTMKLTALANILLAKWNLFPVTVLDGGQMILYPLIWLFGPELAVRISFGISVACIFVLFTSRRNPGRAARK